MAQQCRFASGLYAYARKRLIDYRLGTAMLVTTIPLALLGTCISERIEPDILKAILGVGLFAVAANSLRAPEQQAVGRMDAAILQEHRGGKGKTCLVTSEGQAICYTVCNRTKARLVAALGGLFKGIIATGLGELDEHLFLKRSRTMSPTQQGFSGHQRLCWSQARCLPPCPLRSAIWSDLPWWAVPS